MNPVTALDAAVANRLAARRNAVAGIPPFVMGGRLTRVTGLAMEAVGLRLPIGAHCVIRMPGGMSADAEVVGFSGDKLFLMPVSDTYGLLPGAEVIPVELPHLGADAVPESHNRLVPVGDALLGRILDGQGRPLDGKGPLRTRHKAPLYAPPINPLEREPIRRILDTGIRVINSLFTVGRGQRLGLFAGSGVGKSVLMGMMARYTVADVVVVGLIGERGREVKEFIEDTLGEDGLARSIVVAAPADSPPLMRLHGAAYATAVAEYFRAHGKQVLLIMDSLTRYAMAQREIALAIGEPPATKGYPPSVFAKLPQLIERAGNGAPGVGGSITAFYTVLTEGDDLQDPVADHARAILDGHIVLSRSLADAGHYPAIDIEASISRAFPNLADERHQQLMRQLRQLYSRYQRNRDLINVGAYVRGSDPLVDKALELMPKIDAFLTQGMRERAGVEDSINQLAALFG